MAGDYLKNLTPEQRREHAIKAAATRARNKAEREAAAATRARNKAAKEAVMPLIEEEPEDFSMNEISGSIGEPEPPAPEIADPGDPFSVWLLTLEDDTRALFTDEELRASFEENWKKAKQEQRAKRKKEIADSALAASRANLGLLPAEQLERMKVARQNARIGKFVVSLPPAQSNGQPADIGLRIDGKVLRDGDTIVCTYGEAASYRDIQYRAGQLELSFKGENIRYRAWLLGRSLGVQTGGFNSSMTYEGN